jgi:hypothetical protein
MSQSDHNQQEVQDGAGKTFSEQVEVASSQVVKLIREAVKQGNIRRVIIRTQDDRVLLDTPLTYGAGAMGVAAFLGGLPLLLVTAGVAALARVKVEIIREVAEGDVVEDTTNRVRVEVEDDEPNES